MLYLRKVSVLAIFASFFYSYISFGQDNSNIKKKHSVLLKSRNHINVQFTQTIYKQLRKKTIERKGEASFSKPGKFYWVFKKYDKDNEKYYYDGNTLTHYIIPKKLAQQYSTKSGFGAQLGEIVDLVLDPDKLLTRYSLKNSKSEKGTTYLTLVPNQKFGEIKEIFVKSSDKRKYIKEVKIYYTDGNNTKFAFKNPRFKAISQDTFIFSQAKFPKVHLKRIN